MEPQQSLLGSRYADLALSILFAAVYPVVGWFLKKYAYQVRAFE
jgi:hypothetical protein